MSNQNIFQRYELKYMLTLEQKERLLRGMAPYMSIDKYGRDTIRNIYFDTDNYRLIRHSIEKPVYKEKLRIRSYRLAQPDTKVYVELKKKYKSVVYKRRISLPEQTAMNWLCETPSIWANAQTMGSQIAGNPILGTQIPDSQIAREIEYFRTYYETLHPAVFLSYEREAFYALDGSDFRVTFDDHILVRQDKLSLEFDVGGTPILEDGKVLMELKTSGGIPLWMTRLLTQEKIYKTSFSKYGTAYQTLIYPQTKGVFSHA